MPSGQNSEDLNVIVQQTDLADPRDAIALVHILDAYASDPMGGGQSLRADVKERLASGLRTHPTSLVFLASVDDEEVGAAVCFVGFSTFQARPLINIHDLAVLPEWRGRGVGRALLAAVEQCAIDRGCCKLTLEVLDANRRARSLYERFGFTDVVIADSPMRFLTKSLAQASGPKPEAAPSPKPQAPSRL